MDSIDGKTAPECFGDRKHSKVSWLTQVGIKVFRRRARVAGQSQNADFQHPKRFLKCFLEPSSDSHDLAHGLHTRPQFLRYTAELLQIPTRNLHDHVVQCRFKARCCRTSDGVPEIGQAPAKGKLSSHSRERIPSGFRCESRAARQSRIHFDYAVLLRERIQCKLDIAFSDDAEMAHYAD